MSNLDLLSFLDTYPPFLVYALARTGKRGCGPARSKRPSLTVMIARSGLSESTILRMSKALSWKSFTVESATGFYRACGVCPFAMEKHLRFWRRAVKNGLKHLTKSQQKSLNLKCIRHIASRLR
jgi:hypothetical protein